MVVKMSSPGRSFGGVADYCLHDPRLPGEAHHPESAERVEWTETRNLATSEGERAGRIMAATAEASPELKRLAGGAATGRKLEKPVCHYSLNWAKDEKPDRQEMRRAAAESLKALGMERRQALIVSHRDGQPHVHVIANRVDPESGLAAGLSRSKLKLSKWAEGYEREQGKIRCPARERNNKRREAGERVVDGRGHSGGRFRRERMSPQREPREVIPAQREGPERERVAWQRAEERMHWERIQQWRRQDLGKLERRSKWEWSELYGRQERQREQLAKDCRGVLGRFRAWRELAEGLAALSLQGIRRIQNPRNPLLLVEGREGDLDLEHLGRSGPEQRPANARDCPHESRVKNISDQLPPQVFRPNALVSENDPFARCDLTMSLGWPNNTRPTDVRNDARDHHVVRLDSFL